MRVTVIGGRGQVAQALGGRDSSSFAVTLMGRPTIDLAVRDDLVQQLASTRPDVIVNAAAYTDVDGAEREPAAASAVNADGAARVAAAAAAMGVPLIHLSTDYVYDGIKPEPYVETDAPAPLNAYGRSKLAGERLAAGAAANCTILRTSWVYAPSGRNFVMAMLRLMARESRGITLVPPVVVVDELKSGVLIERYRLKEVKEQFFAITQHRRFPNPLVADLLKKRTMTGDTKSFAGKRA